jgi:hypothetical protein
VSDTPARRQETLAARLGCYYAGPGRGADRPHCEGAGVVAYRNIVLCASCDKMRSAVGRTDVARPIPGVELRDPDRRGSPPSRAPRSEWADP